jgi:hypothetical protein
MNNVLTKIGRLYSVISIMEAKKAEIESMKVENAERMFKGQSLAWDASSFEAIAKDLHNISTEIMRIAKGEEE